jgi:hypothetical protein
MNEKKRGGISRREFARRAAIASAVASIAPATALPANSAPPAAPTVDGSASAAPAQQPANTTKLSPEGQAEAEARFQSILNQYGKRFSEEQKADLRRLCFVAQPPLDRLRAYALANGDAPALYLKPLVEREKDPLAGTRKGKTPTAAKKTPADAFHAH